MANRTAFMDGHQTCVLQITPLNGTMVEYTEADIIQGSLTVDKSSVSGNNVEVGNVSSAELTVSLNNEDGKFNNITLEGATIKAIVTASDGTTTSVLGTFIIDEITRTKTTINVIALDRIVGLDVPMDRTLFTNSMTINNITSVVAGILGIHNIVSVGVNNEVLLNPLLMDENATYRDLLSCACEIGGVNAVVGNDTMNCLWYGEPSVPTILTIDETNRVASDMQGYSVEITGIEVVDGETVYKTGTDDYVISIIDNPLITSDNVATILSGLAPRLIGFTYQPFSAEILSTPSLVSPMRMVEFVKDGTTYTTIITNSLFTLNQNTRVAGKGESPLAKGYAKKAMTKEQANNMKVLQDGINNANEKIDNLEIGGVNLLLDTNAPSLIKVYAPANRYFSNANRTEITTEYISISDAPVDVQYGARFECVTTWSSNRCLAWYSSNKGIGMVDGQEYTASCYCKITTGTTADIACVYGRSTYTNMPLAKITGNEWQRVTWTFTYDGSVVGATGYDPVFYIGMQGTTPVGTIVEICGFQLEQGSKATAYNRNSELQKQIEEVSNYFWHDSEGAHVSNAERDATTGANTLITSTEFQKRTGTVVDASFGSETVIGHTGTEQRNILINDTTIALRRGTTWTAWWNWNSTSSSPQMTLGLNTDTNRNVYINNAGMRIRTGETNDALFTYDSTSSTPLITLGRTGTGENNTYIKNDGVYLRTGTTVNASFKYDSTNSTPQITLGRTGSGQKNVYITNSGMQIRTGTTADAKFEYDSTSSTPTILLGRTGTNDYNAFIDNTSLKLRKGTTAYVELDGDDEEVLIGNLDFYKTRVGAGYLIIEGGESATTSPTGEPTADQIARISGHRTISTTTSYMYGNLMLSRAGYFIDCMHEWTGTTTPTSTLVEVTEWVGAFATVTNPSKQLYIGASESGSYDRSIKYDRTNGIRIFNEPTTLTSPSPTLKIGWDGRLTYGGNNSAIGTIQGGQAGTTFGSKTIATGTSWTNAYSFSLPKGTWLVQVALQFASNTTGRRQACISTTSGGNEISYLYSDNRSPVNGQATSLKVIGVLSPTATTTYYVNVVQNSGGDLNINGKWQALRIL